MTELENQTFEDGFKLLFLDFHGDLRRNVLAFKAQLFDGGRLIEHMDAMESYLRPEPLVLQGLRKMMVHVVSPPHVLVGHGRGWRDFIDQCLPDILPRERVLDLRQTAAALSGRSYRSLPIELAAVLGVHEAALDDELFPAFHLDLLWAVVGEAGRRGLTWAQLLALAAAARTPVTFKRYEFTDQTLAAVPDRPGVYIMFDAQNCPIYVGKAASLSRRLGNYPASRCRNC